MQMVLNPCPRHPSLVHTDVKPIWMVDGGETPHRGLNEGHGLSQLFGGRVFQRPHVTVEHGHQVPRGVGIGIEDQKRLGAPAEDQGSPVVARGQGGAEEAAIALGRPGDVGHPPGGPEAIHRALNSEGRGTAGPPCLRAGS
jgi:hypothetical protein